MRGRASSWIVERAKWWKKISIDGECWIWTGIVAPDGYGQYAGRQAHRVVYERTVGPIPDGLELDHTCLRHACVNPRHLEPVTRAENMRRRSQLQTACKRGHPFTPENTYLVPGTQHRNCRTCTNAAKARHAQRKKLAVTQ